MFSCILCINLIQASFLTAATHSKWIPSHTSTDAHSRTHLNPHFNKIQYEIDGFVDVLASKWFSFAEKINKYFHWIHIQRSKRTIRVYSLGILCMHTNCRILHTVSFSSIPFYLWIYFNVISLSLSLSVSIHFADDLTTTHTLFLTTQSSRVQ